MIQVGDVHDQSTDVRCVRIVHISDTHLNHEAFASKIPNGDILVHSGDFSKFNWTQRFTSKNFEDIVAEIDNFFSHLPHKHKIFVAGNHDSLLDGIKASDIQSRLTNGIYLQDSSVQLEGIKFYGSPWTAMRIFKGARGFTCRWSQMSRCWQRIPGDTDVLVTHMPPRGIMDLGLNKIVLFGPVIEWYSGTCNTCGQVHEGRGHWGCQNLLDVVRRIKPKLHLFGHTHECAGTDVQKDTVFSNAAIPIRGTANIFEYYVKRLTASSDTLPK